MCTAPITRIQYVCNININQSVHSWLNPLLIDLSANMIWISGIKVYLVRHERERTRNLTDNSSFNWLTSRCTEQDWASERLRTDLYFESFLFLFVFETLFIYKIIGGLATCVCVCVYCNMLLRCEMKVRVWKRLKKWFEEGTKVNKDLFCQCARLCASSPHSFLLGW